MNPYVITANGEPYTGEEQRPMLGSGLLTPVADAAYQQGLQDALQQAAQNISGTAKADAAFNNGAAQAKQNHIDDRTATMERGLVGAKQAYMDAQYRGDQQGMANAYQTAQGIRADAKKQGIDLSRFDTSVALEEANKAYQQDAAVNAMQHLRNSRVSLAPGLLGYLVNERPTQQQAQARQAGQATPQEYQPLNQVGRMMATNLIGYKQAWQRAHDAGDEAGMQAAAQGAAMVRDKAKQAGIDLSGYDSGQTLAQAQAALQSDYELGLNKALFGAPTSAQYYDQMYDWARNHGASDGEAQRYAQRKAAHYQANRMADLQAAFYNYGLDPNGGISANGAHIMDLMRNENPQSIGLENAYFTKPSDQWLFDRKIDAAKVQQALQLGLIDKNTAAQLQLYDKQGEIQKALQTLKNAGMVDVARIGANAQVEAAKQRALYGPSSRGGGNDGGIKTEKLSEGQREIVNLITSKYNDVKSLAEQFKESGSSADREALSDAVEDLRTYIDSDDVKKKFDAGDWQKLNYYAYGANFYWNKANNADDSAEMAETAYQIANYMPKKWVDENIPGYNFDGWRNS